MCKAQNSGKIIVEHGRMFKMYGTTMRDYNVNQASGSKDEKKSIFSRKMKNKDKNKNKKPQDTTYMKLEENNNKTETKEHDAVKEPLFSKKDFPIPTVIITVLFTMMMLVVLTGLF